jgi:hypothetical protein
MARTIRFHLDEDVDPAIADGLRRRGIDVTTTPEVRLLGALDPVQLGHARAEGRVLFTHDDDHLRLNAQGIEHSGIAYCHRLRRSMREIIDGLALIWELCEPGEMVNRVEYLSEHLASGKSDLGLDEVLAR